MRVINITKGTEVAVAVQPAAAFWARLRGLMGRPTLAPGEGLFLYPCQAVHTFWMRFPLEIIFLDREGKIVGLETLPPWRVGRVWRKAVGALEVALGTLAASRSGLGDALHFYLSPTEKNLFLGRKIASRGEFFKRTTEGGDVFSLEVGARSVLPHGENQEKGEKAVAYKISDDCVSCGACQPECPNEAISEGPDKYVIDPEKCIDCGACADVCPTGAPQPE